MHKGRAQLRGFHIGRGVKRFAEAVKFARQIPADVVGVNQLIVTLGSADAADKAAVALRKHANVIRHRGHIAPLTNGDGHIVF